ncbi:uncharacterized protein KIAA0232 homolog [Spea bombifrons]|uniref:uncharacterized protein KIAA0232 homolog n=1 Tax=Spea bombifrons TaxID=233779 RepID=UPI00234BA1CB|nr:uncharacterized protein KIAA0232 homolog [Spea bombifrons]
MRPTCTVVDGLPSENTTSSFLRLFSEMSILRALDPVQTWLGQELEKCGIDAMIYTRYILSLLLHDSYDYDLQEQENDIFVGWERGVFKRWGKGKKKSADLTLEEIKKQAAVQCLLSASDESSGIETLVDELCTKLKDLKFNQDEQLPTLKEESNKSGDAPSRDCSQSPAGKDLAEMYYAAFPPLSEKPVCLQETATVWNKSNKVCSSNSSASSSTAPQTSTETPSPKDYNSESETVITNSNDGASNSVHGRNQERKGKTEKKNKFSNGATGLCKIGRRKCNGKIRPRSWSSGSSEAGLSSSDNRGEMKTKLIKVKSKIREVRNKRKSGQRIPTKNDKKKNISGSSSSSADSVIPLCKRVKKQVKECTWKEDENEENDILNERKSETEFREEPLWYTEPITEYLVPLNSRSKLETTYLKRRENLYDASKEVEELSEFVHGLRLNNHNLHETYLSACTIIGGHFVEMPAVINETSGYTETSNCPLQEEYYLDDVHCIEITHFCEVEIDQSMLDSGASDKIQDESLILNIWQKHELESDLEAESCKVLNESLQGVSAIWTQSTASIGAEGEFLEGHSSLAQFWVSCSPSSSVDSDGESLRGDSPDTFSPFFDSTKLSSRMHASNQGLFDEDGSYFTEFDTQCRNSGFTLPVERASCETGDAEACSAMNEFFQTQSRLRIWTRNSAFDENEQCSNISTRTCSPWSHSEENRSDTETCNHLDDYNHTYTEDLNYVAPGANLIFCNEDSSVESRSFLQNSSLGEESAFVMNKKSKLESLCGIQLERENVELSDESSDPKQGYSSGIIKDIWVNVAEGNSEKTEDPLIPVDVSTFSCQDIDATEETFEEPSKAVQRSEYHLWDGQKELIEKRSFFQCDASKLDVGDYTTPSKTWEGDCGKENSFILGGVYGEFKTFNGESEWAVVPPCQVKGSLLECAATDVTTAGTDGFMTSGNSFAPGHRQFWKPFVSFEENQASKIHDRKNIIQPSFVLHENLLGPCNTFQVDEPDVVYSFPSFELNNNFSQCLRVECSCEPGGFSAGSPCVKTESLSSESDDEYRHPRVCGVERTQYRSIRISPRTHFRPISASELSPGGGSESEFDSDKDEVAVPSVSEEVFEYPQDDLQPLEEDAENEGNFYGKSELESGKFLPRLQKSGMEKSAQTSLDDQEELCAMLPLAKRDRLGHFPIIESFEGELMENSKTNCKMLESNNKTAEKTSSKMGPVSADELGEYPPLGVDIQGVNVLKEKQCWWQKALYSPLISGSFCESHYTNLKEEGNDGDRNSEEVLGDVWRPLSIEKTSACNEANVTIDYGIRTSTSRKKMYSNDSSSSDAASDGRHEWADICREELFSRTQL